MMKQNHMMKNIGRTALIASALAGVMMTGSGCATSKPSNQGQFLNSYDYLKSKGYHGGNQEKTSGRNMTPIYNEATSGMFIPKRVIVEHRYRKRK